MHGVYISYPFCAQKCTYCNFASGVFPAALETRYLRALARELRETRGKWTPDTIYLGGGTPSKMEPAALAGLLEEIPGRPWREATIEAAPGGVTLEKAHAWRDAGINRVSLGVQSFVSKELASTGRKHTADTVEREIAVLRDAGLTNINVDLIAGLPGQTMESWGVSLHWIEKLNVPHVSVYMLEVDEDSRLGSEMLSLGQRYGAASVPDDDTIAAFYQLAVERLSAAGIDRYEISNFARAGFESAHNLKYWRREPYLGFGADAHSFDGVERWGNVESPAEYCDRIESGISPVAERAAADPAAEPFFLGLRLRDGVDLDWSGFKPAVERFVRDGLLEQRGNHLRLTPNGILLSNEVFAEFL